MASRKIARNFGTCLKFTGAGTTDKVTLTQTSGLPIYSPTTGYSVSVWVNMTNISNGGAVNHAFYAEGNTANNTQAFLLGLLRNTGQVRVFIRNDANTLLLNSVPSYKVLKIAKWYNITFTDDNGTCHLYIDGIEDENSVSGNYNYTPSATTLNTCGIGYLNRLAPVDYLFGKLDEVKLFNKALSATEVSDLYFYNRFPNANLKGSYLFDEGSGSSVTDRSGLGNTGTISGATYDTDVAMKARLTV